MKQRQENMCALCGTACTGNHRTTKFQVHHIVPQSEGGPSTPDNAIGLCPPCHEYADTLYFSTGRTILEVMMERGIEYELPAPSQTSQDAISGGSRPKTAPHYRQSETAVFAGVGNEAYFAEEGFYPLRDQLKRLFPEVGD